MGFGFDYLFFLRNPPLGKHYQPRNQNQKSKTRNNNQQPKTNNPKPNQRFFLVFSFVSYKAAG